MDGGGGRGGGRHGRGAGVLTVPGAEGADPVVAPAVPGIELGALLATGATSEVWLGVVEGSGRRVAVKVVGAGVEEVEAAAREAAVSAAAASAHVVAVESCVPLADGRVALVLPHVRGGALDALVRARGHLSPGEVVTVLAPLASALGRLHDLGVVHGDVSPGNVLLELDGRPVLADLGLGHVVGEVAHAVWGTEGYIAPEVLLGDDPGPAADVYALGALGWLCLSGQVPGQPGLRPTLAEVSKAGEGSAEVVAALEAAVAPLVDDRPTAHELAWRLFHAAQPEPLHLVHGTDETSAVTRRLRAAAGRPSQARHGRRRPRLPTVPRRFALGLAAVLGALLVAGGAMTGRHLLAPSATSPGRSPVEAASAAVHPGPAAREVPSRASSDVRLDPQAPRWRTVELVAVLAEARARAWREATAAHLLAADAPGSAAEARDRAAVTELARAGLRYTGLRYAVRSAVPVAGTADERTARVRTRIDTGAYAVAGPSGSTPRPAARGDEVVLTLVLTDTGWRVSDVVAAS